MNIVITSDTVGGLGVHAETLAAALNARGHRVTLAVFGASADAAADGLARLALPGPLEWESERDPAQLEAALTAARAALHRLGLKNPVDILHCNHFGCVDAIPGAASLLAVHSDVPSWWHAVHGQPPPSTPFHRWYARHATAALAAAAAVVTPSAAALATLRRSFGYRGPATVVHNGLPATGPAPDQARNGARRGAVMAARLADAAKQASLLLRPDLPMDVVLAGDPGHRIWPPLPRLRYAGPLDRAQLTELFTRAAVYIAPSRYEPFGLAPLEAAFAGCCLLLNDLESFREIWNGAAYYFARNDGGDLMRWLRRLASEPDLIAAGARAAQARARARYTAAAMAERYEALYRQIAPSTCAAPGRGIRAPGPARAKRVAKRSDARPRAYKSPAPAGRAPPLPTAHW